MSMATRTGTQPAARHAADSHELIRVYGARVNNLKDVSVEIPKRRLTVFTGVSGSGKSSLVFGTIAAESQRLINETYSAFVQGFMPTLVRPEVNVLDGLTTAIIVNQERMGADVRSTVGTATDANAMLRILFSRLGQPHVGSPQAFSFNVASISGAGAVACGGLHPATTLPIMLDVGTDNQERLTDPLYLGWRHERVRGQEYDDFVDAVVSAIMHRWPHVLLQWEDFAKNNASRLLERYRDRLCTFNDDIQGTAAVAAGTLLSAINVTGVPLSEQRIAVLGAGSAGCGIAGLLLKMMVEAGLPEGSAAARFYMVDRDGLLVDGMIGIEPFQLPFVQRRAAIETWPLDDPHKISLLDVVKTPGRPC